MCTQYYLVCSFYLDYIFHSHVPVLTFCPTIMEFPLLVILHIGAMTQEGVA